MKALAVSRSRDFFDSSVRWSPFRWRSHCAVGPTVDRWRCRWQHTTAMGKSWLASFISSLSACRRRMVGVVCEALGTAIHSAAADQWWTGVGTVSQPTTSGLFANNRRETRQRWLFGESWKCHHRTVTVSMCASSSSRDFLSFKRRRVIVSSPNWTQRKLMASASTSNKEDKMSIAASGSAGCSSSNENSAGVVSSEGNVVKIEEDFLNSGRTGRRNAIPDIGFDASARVSTAQLPGDFARLSCDGKILSVLFQLVFLINGLTPICRTPAISIEQRDRFLMKDQTRPTTLSSRTGILILLLSSDCLLVRQASHKITNSSRHIKLVDCNIPRNVSSIFPPLLDVQHFFLHLPRLNTRIIRPVWPLLSPQSSSSNREEQEERRRPLDR